MARKVKYIFPNLINSTNVDEWTAAYLNYAMKASVNNLAITGSNPNARRDLDAKMSQLALVHAPNLSAWSVRAFADKIRQVFSLSGSDADVIYSFMVDEFFIWKYGFSAYRYEKYRELFIKAFNNNRLQLEQIFETIFNKAVSSGLRTGNDKCEIILYLASAFNRKGIGASGASALLSLIFPDYIGTCDSVFLKQYNINKGTNYQLEATTSLSFPKSRTIWQLKPQLLINYLKAISGHLERSIRLSGQIEFNSSIKH